ncbi:MULTISPECIES: cytidine deaminase [unclassified Micromonospora]|uniref:cytidine deaminase n=1 Tax=Micromonospora TaxID=1873 RepID=UPI0024159940|nr:MULTISPECIES: cytidine deaminase [unclassified Micromonospora]MDG4817263.1 cytidine deaminase [Micromonospora sp. WMMD956]WFE59828.1 cytidine deaminase [Micromonospora sp. WMMD712]
MTEIDWERLRAAATEVMRHAYVPYSKFPVGAAALVDDGRVVVGCNVENAAYGVVLCAECGVVSSLHATGGGRIVALSCVDATGEPLMPCGRCRQLLWEQGGPQCLIEAKDGPLTMAELLPHAFDVADLEAVTGERPVPVVPDRLAAWRGRGTVFVHADLSAGKQVWTAYWERSAGDTEGAETGVLEEGPSWADAAEAVAWGLARTPRVVVVDETGTIFWAGEGEPPQEIPTRWGG